MSNNSFNASLLFLLAKISKNDKTDISVGKCKKCDSFTVCNRKLLPNLHWHFQQLEYYCYVCGSVVEVMQNIPPSINEDSTQNIDDETKQNRQFNVKGIHDTQMMKINSNTKYHVYHWGKTDILEDFGPHSGMPCQPYFSINIYSRTKFDKEIYISVKEYIELILDYLKINEVVIDTKIIARQFALLLRDYDNRKNDFDNHCSIVSENFIKNKLSIENKFTQIISSCFSGAFKDENLNETMINNNAIIIKVRIARDNIVTKFIF
jgi:hypothetical protein